jgi:la-related protein 1
MTPVQAQYNPMYDYPAMQPLSAVPFAPYAEQFSTLSMVSMQL